MLAVSTLSVVFVFAKIQHMEEEARSADGGTEVEGGLEVTAPRRPGERETDLAS